MNFVDILLYVILPLAVTIYLFLKKKLSYFEELGVPHLKPSLLMGNIGGLGKTTNMVDLLKSIYEECKEKDVIAGFYTLFQPTLIVTDLELVKQITIKEFNTFTDRGLFVNDEKDPLSGNMFSIGGEKWRFLRNKLSPVFTSGKIKMMYSTISDKGDNFVKAMEKASVKGSVDMKDISNRFTIDVTTGCAFGMESNTLKNEHPEFIKILRQILGEEGTGPIRILLMVAFPDFAKFLNMSQFGRDAEKFFYNVIGGSMKYREENDVKRNDFLNMLIELKNKGAIDGEIFSDMRKLTLDQCVAQAFIFFLGGADTSGSTIAYALTELGHLPEIQEKLREEILEKIESTNGEITYDSLHEMTFLNQVVNETLRKFSPNSFTFRQAMADYKIPDSRHTIKKGTRLIIPNLSIHYDERYWKDPEVFDPQRFTAEEIAKRPNQCYMPFGEGPRNCIGMRFALITVKFGIATIIKNFRVTLDTTKTQLPLKFDPKSLIIAPAGGFWGKFEKV